MLLSGCTLSKNKENNIEDNSVGKIDVNKEYVNETLFKSYKLCNGEDYDAKYIDININSDGVKQFNERLKNNIVNNSTLEIKKNKIIKGNIITYEKYVSKEFVTIIENVDSYFEGNIVSSISNYYIFDIMYGKIYNNDGLLEYFHLEEEDLFNKLSKSDVEDSDYITMYVKNNGYYLYVDENEKLIMEYVFVGDNGEEKNKLIIKD
jgi:hypothetical protein